MATTRKYAGLPDLDQAPDVYETPDLADDVSTIPASTARSPSLGYGSDDGRGLGDDEESGVLRPKIDRSSAYSRFQNARVDARKADFSERLNGSKQYYRTSNHRQRRGDDGINGDFSDEDEETLDQKLIRLKREIEEAKTELAERDEDRELFSDAPEIKGDEDGDDGFSETINRLSEALEAVYSSRHGASSGTSADLSQAIAKFDQASISHTTANGTYSQPPTSSPDYQAQLAQALSKAGEFDTRLSFLEQALGITGDSFSDANGDGPKPVLHTLSLLDRQISNLTNSSASVDAASTKTRKLIEQAEQLLKTKQDYDALDHPTTDDTEAVSKINALYGTLSTIDSLSPTLPMVLDRLRTLRLLHTSAANAGSALDEMEKRQAEQAADIKQWKDALDQVEKNVKASESGLVDNVKSVEGWVKELEARVSRLS